MGIGECLQTMEQKFEVSEHFWFSPSECMSVLEVNTMW